MMIHGRGTAISIVLVSAVCSSASEIRALELSESQEAAICFLTGSDAQADKELKEALTQAQQSPKSVEARIRLAQAYERVGRKPEALNELRIALGLNPQNKISNARLAQALLERNSTGEGLEILKKALTYHPHDLLLVWLLGEAYDDRNNIGEAIKAYEEAYQISFAAEGKLNRYPNPELSKVVRTLSIAYAKNNQLEASIRVLEKMAARFPAEYINHEFVDRHVYLLENGGDSTKVIPTLLTALSLSERPSVRKQIAPGLVRSIGKEIVTRNIAAHRNDQTLQFIRTSPSFLPFSDPQAYQAIADVFKNTNQLLEASLALNIATAVKAEQDWYLQRGEYPPLGYVGSLLDNITDSKQWSARALVYDRRQLPDLGRRALQKAWELGKTPPDYALLGRRYERLQNPLQAIKAYERALALKGTSNARDSEQCAKKDSEQNLLDTVAPSLVVLYSKHVPEKDTRAFLMNQIEKDPHNTKLFSLLAQSYLAVGQDAKALNIFQQSVSQNPRDPSAHLDLGTEYARRGISDSAIEAYKSGLLLRPSPSIRAKLYTNLGHAYFEKGSPNDAARAYETALSLDDSEASVHLQLGLALAGQDALAKALPYFLKAAQLDPNNGEAQLNAGWAQHLSGDDEEAIELLTKARDLFLKTGNQEKVVEVDKRLDTVKQNGEKIRP